VHGGEQDNNLQMDNRVLRQLNVKMFFMMYGASWNLLTVTWVPSVTYPFILCKVYAWLTINHYSTVVKYLYNFLWCSWRNAMGLYVYMTFASKLYLTNNFKLIYWHLDRWEDSFSAPFPAFVFLFFRVDWKNESKLFFLPTFHPLFCLPYCATSRTVSGSIPGCVSHWEFFP
jgi:hypothetical protein